jgi:hypothetical protein
MLPLPSLLLYPTANMTKKWTNFDATVPPLYQTGVKMGTSIRYSKKSQGKEGKKIVQKTKTTQRL